MLGGKALPHVPIKYAAGHKDLYKGLYCSSFVKKTSIKLVICCICRQPGNLLTVCICLLLKRVVVGASTKAVALAIQLHGFSKEPTADPSRFFGKCANLPSLLLNCDCTCLADHLTHLFALSCGDSDGPLPLSVARLFHFLTRLLVTHFKNIFML